MTIYLSLLCALIGILMYALCASPKLSETGRITYFTGILTFLLNGAEPFIRAISK